MKKILALILLIAVCMTAQPASAGAARDRLEEGINKIIAIFNDPKYKGMDPKPQEMKDRFRVAIKEYFDFRELSKWALGKPWNKFTPEERDKFVTLFTDLLEQTYLQKIMGYTDEMKVEYDKETPLKDNYVQVDTRVMAKAGPIPVSYSLKNDSRWMVYDVNAEGVSLVKNYRTQFGELLDSSTPEKFEVTKKDLFVRLTQKIKELAEKKDKKD